MNRVILCGRLVKDVDVRYTERGMCVASFTVACNRPAKKGQASEADFIPCKAFGKTAETIGNYLAKGSRVLLEGRINTGSYTAKDGTKRYTTDVLLDRFEFVESRNGGSTGGDNAAQGGFTQQAAGHNNMTSFGHEIDPEEIPF